MRAAVLCAELLYRYFLMQLSLQCLFLFISFLFCFGHKLVYDLERLYLIQAGQAEGRRATGQEAS